MDSDSNNVPAQFNEAKIRELKEKYSQELKDVEDNPIKVCLKLVFQAATEKESAKRNEISFNLSKFLTEPDGIINLFLALIDFDLSSQKVTTHNQRFTAIANVITCLPNLCTSYEEYCKNILHQLKPLLVSDNPKYSSLSSIIVKAMLESHHARDQRNFSNIILEPIFKPLMMSTEASYFVKPHETIRICETLIQNYLPYDLFIDLFPNLFYCLVALGSSPSGLKLPLKTILTSIMNNLKPGPACCLLEKTLFHSENIVKYRKEHNESGEISVEIVDTDSEDYDFSRVKSVVLDLVEHSKNESLFIEFFFLLNQNIYTERKDLKELNLLILQSLLENAVEEKSTGRLDIMSSIASNRRRTLELIARTLTNHTFFLNSKRQEVFKEAQEMISLSAESCLNLLEVLISTTTNEEDLSLVKTSCLPAVNSLKLLLEQEDKSFNDNKLYENLKIFIEYANSKCDHLNCLRSTENESSNQNKEYESIIADLNDKLVPVRVHALVRLRQLVMMNDKTTSLDIEKICSKIESTLADDEPYVFLASIRLMAEMTVRKTREILPKLKDLYLSQEIKLQQRMNVGEIFVRLFKQLNETTPFYAQQVMETLFQGCKDPEELIRMSSLTNIGELCRNLGDSLSNYILDILTCVKLIFETDTIEVKCAAVDLLRTALSGLDRLKIETIQRELKEIYRLLKNVRSRALDEHLLVQADLALDEMDRIARELVIDGNSDDGKLIKNIKVRSLL